MRTKFISICRTIIASLGRIFFVKAQTFILVYIALTYLCVIHASHYDVLRFGLFVVIYGKELQLK